jgi:hypothetical protein
MKQGHCVDLCQIKRSTCAARNAQRPGKRVFGKRGAVEWHKEATKHRLKSPLKKRRNHIAIGKSMAALLSRQTKFGRLSVARGLFAAKLFSRL